MGTRTPKVMVLVVAVCLALSPLVWAQADEPAPAPPAAEAAPAETAPAEAAPVDSAAPGPDEGIEIVAVARMPLQSPPPPGATSVDDSTAAVYYYDDPDLEAWITIGAMQGLRVNAEVVFYRKGAEVTRGRVVETREADALVRAAEGPSLVPVQRGDIVRVVQNGSHSDVSSYALREKAKRAFLTYTLSGLAVFLTLTGM